AYALLKQGDSPNVMPLFAKIVNPYYATQADKNRLRMISARDKSEGRRAADEWTKELKAQGYDGVILEYPASMVGEKSAAREIVVFDPAGVKSATGNRGTFDPSDPDIRFSVARNTAASRGPIIEPATIAEVKKRAASAAKNVAQSIYRYPELFASAMIDRVRKVDRGLASEADRVVSRTKALIGSVDSIVNHALRFSGSPMWTKSGRPIAALSRHTEKGRGKNGRWFTSLMTDAVASNRYYNQLDADQKQMVDHIRAVNRATGRMAENAGVMRVTSTGEVVPFKVRDGQVFVR